MQMIRLSIIIVTYNCEEFVEKCLKSVINILPKDGEIIIVDNASTDGTLKRVKGQGARVKIIKNNANLGFSKANNIGAKEANGEYLFFLNPDTEIKEDIFDELINFYTQTTNVGIVAPKLVLPNGEVQSSVRNLPTVWRAFKEYILGIKHEYSEYVPNTDGPIKVEMVNAAAILTKKDFFEKIGRFSEKYFLYYEDVDLCDRVRKAGKKIYYYPKVSINHLVGATKSSKNKYNFNYQSSKIYHNLLEFYLLQLIFIINRIKNKL